MAVTQGESVNEYIFRENKGFRLLNIYERLNKGETVNKEKLADEFGVSPKTIQRDLMFSEFYFYLIAFSVDDSVKHPVIYRVDRIADMKPTGEKFSVPYKDRFSDGEFRKRIQFMCSGELKKVRFEYSGVLKAILDRLTTAKIISENNGVYTMVAEAYGDGIDMWLRSQGKLVKIINNIKP